MLALQENTQAYLILSGLFLFSYLFALKLIHSECSQGLSIFYHCTLHSTK